MGAELAADILNAKFVHGLKGVLEPGRTVLFLVVNETGDAAGDETDEVECHLKKVLRKMGVGSRTQLARVLLTRSPLPGDQRPR